MQRNLSAEQMLQMMAAIDCFTWITENKLQLSHGPWELAGHEYQVGWLQEKAREQCFIKGAQIGATEALVLRTLHGMIHGNYKTGSLYLFPTRDDVKDFSKSRFDPLIAGNDFIRAYVKDTDAQNIKRIGRGYLYLRGARSTKSIGGTKASSSQLKSIAVDRIIFDELDEMEWSMIQLAKERVSHSKIKEVMYLGTPTIPDYGMDKLYQQSDQRVWMLTCPKCGKETSLDLEFPNCLIRRPDDSVYRACVHCKGELNPAVGRWEAQYPGRDMVGWWISQLNSVYIEPKYILDLYEDPPNGDLSEVMNSKLGRAYIPAENRLHPSDVYRCCDRDPMKSRSDGPCCMGVDVGKELHVVIAERKDRRTLNIVKLARVESFNDVYDLGKQFNVECAVFDLRPETRKVREFQRQANYQVFGCEYVETKAMMTAWDERERVIKCNRTEICDATHDLVMNAGGLILPRRNTEIDEFVKEMCNIAKILEEDPVSGAKTYRYKKLGADHYRHALNYCLLASERTGIVSDQNIIAKFFSSYRRRSPWTA